LGNEFSRSKAELRQAGIRSYLGLLNHIFVAVSPFLRFSASSSLPLPLRRLWSHLR
jgi:hypothetical protein